MRASDRLPWEATVRMELDQNQKRKILEMAQGREIVTECEACGSKEFAVSDTADPVGEGRLRGVRNHRAIVRGPGVRVLDAPPEPKEEA